MSDQNPNQGPSSTSPDPTKSSPGVAEDLAAQALAAAQAAISGLEGEPTARASSAASSPAAGAGPSPFKLNDLSNAPGAAVPDAIALLSDVNLNVKIELGRTRMLVEDVLKLSAGAVVELDKLAGDPVDIYVNDRHIARGEVLVLNDNFCVRVNEILAIPTDAAAPRKSA